MPRLFVILASFDIWSMQFVYADDLILRQIWTKFALQPAHMSWRTQI